MDLDLSPFGMKYVVYSHSVDGVVIYVGSGTLGRAFAFSEFDRNEKWRNEYQDGKIKVKIISFFQERRHAFAFEKMMISEMDPKCNLNRGETKKGSAPITKDSIPNPPRTRNNSPIRCDQTGEVFSTTKSAGQHFGISQGAVSNVVNGRYPSVKGYTFSRVQGQAKGAR